jgi:carboxypeptidase C (cathepsin A)
VSDAVVVVSSSDELKKLLGTPDSSTDAEAKAEPVVRSHELSLPDGSTLHFETEAAKMPVEVGDDTVELFYTAYRRTDVDDVSDRPVCFCFNGGPGSSSVWLHMGGLGPWRAPGDVGSIPRRARPVPNPHTLLVDADLVFIDPATTGFSAAKGDKAKPFTGVKGDVASVGDLIRRYCTRHKAWSRPIHLIGESYGTTRAAQLAKHLVDTHGLAVDGLVLVSVALQLGTLLFTDVHDVPHLLAIPSFAATAVYHGQVAVDDLDAHLAEVEAFTYDELAPALIRGDRVPVEERRALAERLAGYLGVSAEFVQRCHLRVSLSRFCRELLRDQGLMVGRLDSRFAGPGPDAQGEHLPYDPGMDQLTGLYARAYHSVLAEHLGVTDEAAYTILSRQTNRDWQWDDATNQALDVAHQLRDALNSLPHLRVLVASGRFDLATPYAAADYTMARLGLQPSVRSRIDTKVYDAGHMMYIHEPSRLQLDADIKAFLQG